ncbi:MAG: translocation and assembly module TamA [Sphingomonadales bacterium]|jgi:translocation and assembly module TamA|nr:translocation and assembly module TamA [Sphingomonadales bacterium]
MLQVVAGRRAAALSAVLALILWPAAAGAQTAELPPPPPPADQPLDPSAPMEEWPDLGVEWPDMERNRDEAIPDLPGATVAASDAAAARSYSYTIAGLDAAEAAPLLARFRALSTLEEYRGSPANAAQIDRRARADAELMEQLLRAYGYYDGMVTTRVEAVGINGFSVTLDVQPGQLYRFTTVVLPGLEDAAGADAGTLRRSFAVNPQDPVNAEAVRDAQAALRAELGRRGYAFAAVGEEEVVLDHATGTALLTLPVETAGARRFGHILVEGRPLFDARHIATIARFHEGDPWRSDRVEDLRQALVATGIVSSVAIRPVARPDSDLVDLAVALEPAPMRTVAGEAGYGTGEGIRLELSWQHRNLLPPEGAVTFRGVAGTREQSLSAILRRSNFGRRDQVLNLQAAASNVNRPAYDARMFTLAGGIERQSNIFWQKVWTWSIGAELTATDERDVDVASGTIRQRTFFIGAIPAYLGYDGSNDLLDPTSGFRLSARVSPEASLQSGSFFYGRVQLDGSLYWPATSRITLAARSRLGTIFGASRDRIAPSRRFYAGGGGSVRGYGFQALGPRDPVFNDPIGGRSLTEFALEARIRVGNFGIVPFLDAGNVSTSALPRLDNLQLGAGLGVRYHTRFGPIRVDVGTPLNPRSGDPRIAVYVSLGQAF